LSEANIKNESSDTQRRFDWGPPASSTGDTLKDWLVYFAILILLAGGVWALLDINGSDDMTAAPARLTKPVIATTPASSAAVVAKPALATAASAIESRFFVQLGAFADEASARAVFNQLDAEGFAPTLAEPDSQIEIYRIFVGPYPDEPSAEAIAEKLNAIDFHCFVIEQP
jgi:hypothetical protein